MTRTPRLTLLGSRVGKLEQRIQPRPKTAAPIYSSPEWRSLLASIIARRGRRCEKCGITGTKIYGDHRVELSDGGAPLDAENIQLLCSPCHGRKTADERAKRMARRW